MIIRLSIIVAALLFSGQAWAYRSVQQLMEDKPWLEPYVQFEVPLDPNSDNPNERAEAHWLITFYRDSGYPTYADHTRTVGAYRSYNEWPQDLKEQLQSSYSKYLDYLDHGGPVTGEIYSPENLDELPQERLTISPEDARQVYCDQVGFQLAYREKGLAKWTVGPYTGTDQIDFYQLYAEETLEILYGSRMYMIYNQNPIVHAGIQAAVPGYQIQSQRHVPEDPSFPTGPSRTYEWMLAHGILTDQEPQQIVRKLLRWGRRLNHATLRKDALGHAGTEGYYSLNDTLEGVVPPDQARQQVHSHWTNGCSGTTALLGHLGRLVGIPVTARFHAQGHTMALFFVHGQSSPWRYMTHADNLNIEITPWGAIARPGTPMDGHPSSWAHPDNGNPVDPWHLLVPASIWGKRLMHPDSPDSDIHLSSSAQELESRFGQLSATQALTLCESDTADEFLLSQRPQVRGFYHGFQPLPETDETNGLNEGLPSYGWYSVNNTHQQRHIERLFDYSDRENRLSQYYQPGAGGEFSCGEISTDRAVQRAACFDDLQESAAANVPSLWGGRCF